MSDLIQGQSGKYLIMVQGGIKQKKRLLLLISIAVKS